LETSTQQYNMIPDTDNGILGGMGCVLVRVVDSTGSGGEREQMFAHTL